jgi:hypothetical protein
MRTGAARSQVGHFDEARFPGLGLWVTHQLDLDTALVHAGDGFTVRLRAGTLPD